MLTAMITKGSVPEKLCALLVLGTVFFAGITFLASLTVLFFYLSGADGDIDSLIYQIPLISFCIFSVSAVITLIAITADILKMGTEDWNAFWRGWYDDF